MIRLILINLIFLRFIYFLYLIIVFFEYSKANPIQNLDNQHFNRTSVIVLVDFSKSFPASYEFNGSIVYGFRREDLRALNALASVLAELAFSGPTQFKTVWTQIQSSSIIEYPLCPTLEISPRIVKRESSIETREELYDTLLQFVSIMNKASRDKSKLGNYTDISGAISIASEMGYGQYSDNIIIILSDFLEDLPPESKSVNFKLNGETFILLHRPGTDERENISGYLMRIQKWKQKLLQRGARTVATLPVFAASEIRLKSAIRQEEIGTSLNILVDCKENRFQPSNLNKTPLAHIGKALAELSIDMPTPITTLWMSIGKTGFISKTLPLVEFHPRLIKRDNTINTGEDFSRIMEELAFSLPNIGKEINSTDISGSLALVCSADPPAKSSVYVIISDFLDENDSNPTPFQLSPNSRVLMIHVASSRDRFDPNAYLLRRQKWEKIFLDNGAISVCQIPLLTLTKNDLRSCLNPKSKRK